MIGSGSGSALFGNGDPTWQQYLRSMAGSSSLGAAPMSFSGPAMPAPRQPQMGGPMPAGNMQGPQPQQGGDVLSMLTQLDPDKIKGMLQGIFRPSLGQQMQNIAVDSARAGLSAMYPSSGAPMTSRDGWFGGAT